MGSVHPFAGSRRTAVLVLAVLVAVGPLLVGARPARAAAIFTVNRTADGATTVRGRLNSTPDRAFLVEGFSHPTGEEGKVLRGEARVRTNRNGTAGFVVQSAEPIAAGHDVAATATGAGGTSEVSPAERVT